MRAAARDPGCGYGADAAILFRRGSEPDQGPGQAGGLDPGKKLRVGRALASAATLTAQVFKPPGLECETGLSAAGLGTGERTGAAAASIRPSKKSRQLVSQRPAIYIIQEAQTTSPSRERFMKRPLRGGSKRLSLTTVDGIRHLQIRLARAFLCASPWVGLGPAFWGAGGNAAIFPKPRPGEYLGAIGRAHGNRLLAAGALGVEHQEVVACLRA